MWAVPAKSGAREKNGPIRVLLFASGPDREYQFLKTLFGREVRAKRMELGIFLQSSKVEEILLAKNGPSLWTLSRFPDLRVSAKAADKPYVLADYDVVIAFDPDWQALPKGTNKQLRDWVCKWGGSLVLIAGPVHTRWQVRPDAKGDRTPILDLFPVILDRYRIKKSVRHRKPMILNFSATAKAPFLKLDEQGSSVAADWDLFFYGIAEDTKEKREVVRGFYTCYPVKTVKAKASVLATIGAGEQKRPYLVTMPAGVGKVVYLGSGETWRLRMYRSEFHERFWRQLVKYLVPGRK
jgi:hypothetical protein